jgi:hypothetical protein
MFDVYLATAVQDTGFPPFVSIEIVIFGGKCGAARTAFLVNIIIAERSGSSRESV